MTSPALALCLEQTLGHRAHGLNLEAAVRERYPAASVHRVVYGDAGRLPVPWAFRGSRQAVQKLKQRHPRPDATLFHTSTISLFAPRVHGNYVVSLDATPLQVDAMGEWYAHPRGGGLSEGIKRRWYRSVFGRAAGLVAWSHWAADSLVDDYGADRSRILVAHPGAPDGFFAIPRPETTATRPRILFVGGDFARKGGDVLLEAFAPLAGKAELLLVTDTTLRAAWSVRRCPGVRPGSRALHDAFASADIFCLPTRGDCTSVAIGEAMAAGLPVVTTRVGSNAETVRHNETGLLVDTGSVTSLRDALSALVDDAALRRRMGAAARADARDRMHAPGNAARIIGLLRDAA